MSRTTLETFEGRLASVNKEMLQYLDAATRTKEELQKELVGVPSSRIHTRQILCGAAPSTTRCVDPHSPLLVRTSTSSDSLQREIFHTVQREIQQYDSRISELVTRECDLRTNEIEASLRTRFAELKEGNASLGRIVVELSEQVARTREDFNARISSLEADVYRKVNDTKRETLEVVRQTQNEARSLRFDFVEQCNFLKAEVDGFHKLSDGVIKKYHDILRNHSTNSEERLNTHLNSSNDAVRELRKTTEAQMGQLQWSLEKVGAQCRANEDIASKVASEMIGVSDEQVHARSELRICRSDVNQVELFVRSSLAGIKLGKPSTGSSGDDHGMVGVSVAEFSRVLQDVYALKQSVAYLGDVVQERTMQQCTATSKKNSAREEGAKREFPVFSSSVTAAPYQLPTPKKFTAPPAPPDMTEASVVLPLATPPTMRYSSVHFSDDDDDNKLARSSLD